MRRDRLNIVSLMETMIGKRDSKKVISKCGYLNGVKFSSSGNSGGMCLWCEDVDLSVLALHDHHILVKVNNREEIVFDMVYVGIYAWSTNGLKFKLLIS